MWCCANFFFLFHVFIMGLWWGMFTSPTTNVLAFSVQLQHLVIELKYNVAIADNGAPKSYETQNKQTNKQKSYALSVKVTTFLTCTLLHLILWRLSTIIAIWVWCCSLRQISWCVFDCLGNFHISSFLTHYMKFKCIVSTCLGKLSEFSAHELVCSAMPPSFQSQWEKRRSKKKANLLSLLVMTRENSRAYISLRQAQIYLEMWTYLALPYFIIHNIFFSSSLTEFKLICEELPYCFLAFSVYISGQLMSIAKCG